MCLREKVRCPCGHRVTSPSQPLFYDVMLQQGSETWHMEEEHAIGFEDVLVGGCHAKGPGREQL